MTLTPEQIAYFDLLVEQLDGNKDAAEWFMDVQFKVTANVLDAIGEHLFSRGHADACTIVQDFATKLRKMKVPA